MKTIKLQIEDALRYLERPGNSPEDVRKAIEILSHLARGKKGGDDLIEEIKSSKPSLQEGNIPWGSLNGLELVIAIGHEPGGGTSGERTWNTKLAKAMKVILDKYGAIVHIYYHKIKSYGARQRALASWIRNNVKSAFLCWELHYDAVKNPSANGHHFKYRGAKQWAVYTQDEWSNQYPHSNARNSYGDGPGLHHATSGNGSGFLKEMPCWALLTEPFFNSNPSERSFYKPRIEEIAFVFCAGAARFAKAKGK